MSGWIADETGFRLHDGTYCFRETLLALERFVVIPPGGRRSIVDHETWDNFLRSAEWKMPIATCGIEMRSGK